jgi:hypothetical protein
MKKTNALQKTVPGTCFLNDISTLDQVRHWGIKPKIVPTTLGYTIIKTDVLWSSDHGMTYVVVAIYIQF